MSKFISSIWDYGYVSKNENNHDIYRWLGKLPPELVRDLIELYSDEGDDVLANFSGSGTVALECKLSNRNCYAVDSNPVSVLLSNSKITNPKLNINEFFNHLETFKSYSNYKMSDFENKWFTKHSYFKLVNLKEAIDNYDCSKNAKNFLNVVFSSVVKKSSKVDPRSINHIVTHKNYKEVDPFKLFEASLEKSFKTNTELKKIFSKSICKVVNGDARKIKLESKSIDFIISHPPYLGYIDYSNITKLETYFLREEYQKIKNSDISTNNLNKFLEDMDMVVNEISRVLKPDKFCAMIIGDNRKNGKIIPASSGLIELYNKNNLELIDIFIWKLNKKAGMNVKRHGNHIDHNYIHILKKPNII